MTVTTKALVPTTLLVAGTTTPYTCTVRAAILDRITVYNGGAGAVTISIMLDGAVALSNTLMSKILQPLESYLCPEIAGHTLNTDQSFTITTSTPSVVLRISGREVT